MARPAEHAERVQVPFLDMRPMHEPLRDAILADLAEVVDANAVRREQSRERYRYYRDRGYKLNTHQV